MILPHPLSAMPPRRRHRTLATSAALAAALAMPLLPAPAAAQGAARLPASGTLLQGPQEPKVERLEAGGANQPYRLRGRRLPAHARDEALVETGVASWYGAAFHGRRTASGEPFDMHAFTAAHPTMPLPSWAVVHNPANGRRVVVRVNDRGPFSPRRVIDLSRAAARALDIHGLATVTVERLTHEAIRTGSWRRAPSPADGPPGGGAETDVAGAAHLPQRPPTAEDPAASRDDRVEPSDPG